MNIGPCLGCGWMTLGTSDDDDVGPDRCALLGDAGTVSDVWLCPGVWTDESIDVGGGSCGGETWGVIIAGSLNRFL